MRRPTTKKKAPASNAAGLTPAKTEALTELVRLLARPHVREQLKLHK